MNNEIYRGMIAPAPESPDGESPSFVCVTEENNGWLIWFCDFHGTTILHWEQYNRDRAIEYAVARKDSLVEERQIARAINADNESE